MQILEMLLFEQLCTVKLLKFSVKNKTKTFLDPSLKNVIDLRNW